MNGGPMMPVSHQVEPIGDEESLRRAVAYADVPLLAAIAQATGDWSVLRDDLRPDLSNPLDPMAGWTPEQQEAAQQAAFEALSRWRAEGGRPADPGGDAQLRRIMEFAVGGSLADDYVPLLREELGIGEDLRAPGWRKDDLAPDRPFLVAVVGAGMSGLIAGHRLQQAGVPYVILDKNEDVGGTWLENTYPGCRVDVPNHLYSYSFAQNQDWPQHFSSQDVLLSYFRQCADDLGLRPHIRFRTEVVSATFSDATCSWSLELDTPDGRQRLEANAVIMAVGQLNRPHMPEIPGIDQFAGPSFHSARWDSDIDLAGKRVAVIGTGASAAQLIPVVAREAAEVTVFQRTANWLAPTPDYHEEMPEGRRWLFRHVPFYSEWYRFWLFYRSADGLLPATEVDPAWSPQGDGATVSAFNELLRTFLVDYLAGQLPDNPELLSKVVPNYPPAAKRILRDNGIWIETLKRDNVRLVTDAIARVSPRGVVTADGTEHPADVIVYGTGFLASHFLTPMTVTGRNGVDLHERWGGDARAYLGMTVPEFPNLFCLYGPNTNIVVNGSIIFFSECEVRYIMGCLRMLLEGGHAALECRTEVHDAYNVRIDEGNRRRAWGASDVNSWYKNARGRVTQNWPFSLHEYWRLTQRPEPGDFEFLDPAPAAAQPAGSRA